MELVIKLIKKFILFCLYFSNAYIAATFAEDIRPISSTANSYANSSIVSSSATSSISSAGRNITITNQCPFDVSLQSVGANAAVMACSPSTSNAQANCPTNYVCYNKDTNTSYCVAGSVKKGVKKFPIASQKDIVLNAATCKSGSVVTDDKSLNWGQCSCSANNQCGDGQMCQLVTPTLNQCYWGFSLPNNGVLTQKNNKMSLSITPNNTSGTALVASGKFYAKFGCDVNGNCLSDNSKGAPATLIEYTFQNNNDWYDISYINGINLPATMTPVLSTSLDYKSTDPYRCMAAGGDGATISSIVNFQTSNNIKGNTTLSSFACANNYGQTFDGALSGFNFVSPVKQATSCTAQSDCKSSGLVCGLTLAEVQSGGTSTTCGNRLGYWTYAQFCSAYSSYNNSTLGIACGTSINLAYALCKNQSSVTDQGPGRSCFNSTTTKKKDTCCGYELWTIGGNAQPIGVGDAPVAGVKTSEWKTNILPVVKPIKTGCPLAYSYQYDDPYSTFTCATKTQGNNNTSYNVTLCPSGSAGINPPTPPACTALVPSSYQADEFTISAPKGISVVVKSCSVPGTCSTTVAPTVGAIYTAASSGQYQITATNKSKKKQICTFTIPTSGCISPVNPSQQCANWVIAPDGAWQNRSIGIGVF